MRRPERRPERRTRLTGVAQPVGRESEAAELHDVVSIGQEASDPDMPMVDFNIASSVAVALGGAVFGQASEADQEIIDDATSEEKTTGLAGCKSAYMALIAAATKKLAKGLLALGNKKDGILEDSPKRGAADLKEAYAAECAAALIAYKVNKELWGDED